MPDRVARQGRAVGDKRRAPHPYAVDGAVVVDALHLQVCVVVKILLLPLTHRLGTRAATTSRTACHSAAVVVVVLIVVRV